MAVTNPSPPFKQPVAVGSGFGRFFYGADNRLMYSQVLETEKAAGRCYQNNDPTSDEISDLLATDGGMLTLSEAVNIRAIRQYKLGVLVFCENGLWFVYGKDGGFSADSYNVSKISERGIDSPRSVVSAEGSIFYFSDNGIMQVSATEFDNVDATDITEQTIKSFYLDKFAGRDSIGYYNAIDKEIWWVNPSKLDRNILVMDLVAGAFYPQEVASTTRNVESMTKTLDKFLFLNSNGDSTSMNYSFATLKDRTFKDFGVDQTAYMVSGYETLGKFAHKKAVGQAMFFFNKTETTIEGFDETTRKYTFDSPSSCLFQSRWDFDNSNAYAKWVGRTTTDSGRGKKMELYSPLQRGFIPNAFPYTFDTGESILSKKVNIRGNGKAVQFRFEAQPEKDLQLLGYSVDYSMKGRK